MEFTREYNDYLSRKLKHYNLWLMDVARPLDSKYPGFPEDAEWDEKTKTRTAPAKKVAAKTPRAKTPRAVVKRSSKAPTKQQRANVIVETFYATVPKDELITKLSVELPMTRAGATTYYYNALRALPV